MDVAKTTPQRKFRQISHPHEHNFSVPSFGCDFRLTNKGNQKNLSRQQSVPRTTSEFKQTNTAQMTTSYQPQPLNSVITTKGPSVDQTADFTYSTRLQIKDTQNEAQQGSNLISQKATDRQPMTSEASAVSTSPLAKQLRSRPGSMYLPKLNDDVNLSGRNMNPERNRLLQLSHSKSLRNSPGLPTSSESQHGNTVQQSGSYLSRNADKRMPSSNSMSPLNSMKYDPSQPGTTSNGQTQPSFNNPQQVENRMSYPQWQQYQSQPQPTMSQPSQSLQPPPPPPGGWVMPQTAVSTPQLQTTAPNNPMAHTTSSPYDMSNSLAQSLSSMSSSNTNPGAPYLYVIPQNYVLAPGMASLPNSQNPMAVSYLQTQSVQNPQLLPGTTVLQPQVAIVAVDPETLRAILSGTFNTQALFPAANISNPVMTSSLNLPTQTTGNNNMPSSVPAVAASHQIAEPQVTSQSESGGAGIQRKQPWEENKYVKVSSSGNDLNNSLSTQSSMKSTQKPGSDYSSSTLPSQNSSNIPSQTPAPKLGNPPRTLRFLEKSETGETITQTEDCQRSGIHTGREPKKLNPSSFIFRSRKSVTEATSKTLENDAMNDLEPWKASDADTLGRRQEVSSISAYYEQMKRRNNRPLSAYKPTTESQRPSTISPSSLKSSGGSPNFDSSPVNRRSTHQLTRGHTIASSKPDCPRSSTFSEERAQLKETDPSIMTVAERARQWQLAQLTGQRDSRYSTSGFIDQDLVDCQELVPVEDRVKMFDTGVATSRQTEKNPELTSELKELRERKQVKFGEDNPVKSSVPLKSTNLANKSVASVTLQARRLNHVNPRRPHSSVNLQRIKQEPLQTGLIQKPTNNNIAPITQQNNSNLKIAPVKGIQQSNGDELTRLSLNEKRNLFNQRAAGTVVAQGQPITLNSRPLNITTALATTNTTTTATTINTSEPVKRVIRRKTQPITLDDLARANQLILERYYGKHLESPFGSVKGDEQDSFGFHEYDSQISTPEASLLSP
ncbi:unnamed protein product [Trichobilharzia szidati]|nr:unnamed protein product [Trichobilharzia szidati]